MPRSPSHKHLGVKRLPTKPQKRDHKQLGMELDLFTFSDLVGGGLPLWTPRGTLLRDLLDDLVWQLRKHYGYERVDIPHLAKKELYQKSGHWGKFKDDLFKIVTREKHLFVLKPINCPHHTQIYARKIHSYRELPIRYATTTKVYRDEQTGELAGLSRVRAITQDDAHVFCRKPQLKEEVEKIWSIVESFYGAVGFTDFQIRLSLHDPKKQKQYLGTPKMWQEAETELRAVIQKRKVKAVEVKGEAAFYGPKIDFITKDSLNREWQLATIQVDLNMPERFNLTCINEKGKPERIVMIHAAIMGSIERLLSVLLEHFAGAFPLWLSPTQVQVIAVSQKHQVYAKKITDTLNKKNIRVELTDSNETLNKRIREGETQKIPYLLIVGDKEVKVNSVAVRKRGKGDVGTQKLSKFIETIKKEISQRK